MFIAEAVIAPRRKKCKAKIIDPIIFNYLNFYQFFTQLGFAKVKNSNTFRISGCGMDMIFHTNYTIMHQLCRYGFITKKECENLAQKTPQVI